VDALVQQIHDDWVLKINEDKEVQSDIVNQHPMMVPLDTVPVLEKDDKNCPSSKTKANCIEGKSMVKPSNASSNSQQVRRRNKVVPSLTGLKKIARLSVADRNELIRSLKRSKKKKAKVSTSKSSSGNKKCVSLSAGSENSDNSKRLDKLGYFTW